MRPLRFLTSASILLSIVTAAAIAQQTAPSATAPPTAPATAPAKTGTISGTVIGPNDQPLAGATVGYLDPNTRLGPGSPEAARAAMAAGIVVVNTGLNTVVTNEKGEFTLKDVPVGTWQVVASVVRAPGAGAMAAAYRATAACKPPDPVSM